MLRVNGAQTVDCLPLFRQFTPSAFTQLFSGVKSLSRCLLFSGVAFCCSRTKSKIEVPLSLFHLLEFGSDGGTHAVAPDPGEFVVY